MAPKIFSSFSHALGLRVISALIGIPICLMFLSLGSPFFDSLIIAALAGCLYEWARISQQSQVERKILALVLIMVLLFYYSNFAYLIFIFPLSILLFLFYCSQRENSYQLSFLKSLGFSYITTSMLVLLHFSYIGKASLIFFLLLVVWTADTSAYFVGQAFKGPKLAPSLSPSKTWSGLVGGIILPLFICYISSQFLSINLSLFSCFILIMSSHLGDLLESALKRYYNVKDSGSLIPGHGGLLDRLDSLFLISLVAAYMFL